MSEVKFGLLHCHSENSVLDSVMSVETLVKRAKELGAPAVALTDHGRMTGYIDFIKACQNAEINPIVGVEAYVEENTEGRKHLILMAKDYQGFKAIIKAVSESNRRVVKIGTLSFPRMNKEMLKKHFGPGTPGHGHVIATSACVSGVLAAIILANKSITEKVDKLKAEQSQYESPYSGGYAKNRDRLEQLKILQKSLFAEITVLKKEANRSLTALEKKTTGKKLSEEQRQDAVATYQKALHMREEAGKTLELKKKEKEKVDGEYKRLNGVMKLSEKGIEKWKKKEEEIEAINARYISDDMLGKTLEQEALWYQEVFGTEDFYIELQYHGMADEKRVMTKLADLSDRLRIPVCLANDAHMPAKTGDDILARAIIRTKAFEKWEDPSAPDKELYIKTDEELIEKISEILPSYKVMEGYENIGKIVSQCHLEIPKENHYPKFVTPDGSTPEEYLRKMAYAGIPKRYPDGFIDYERLEHELDVICSMGYADYHCIVEDFLRYARAAGKLDLNDPEQQKLALSFDIEAIEKYTEHMVGECVGPGRGSAAGSLVCYLIGITNIDPLKYGLLFERFLNPERVSMPDIDCDIESNVRPYVILYVKHKYGENSVCGIMTRGKETGKAAIQTAGRVYGIQKAADSTAYSNIASEISKAAVELSDDELHINLHMIADDFDRTYLDPGTGTLQTITTPGLKSMFKDNQVALEIIRYAVLIENAMSQIGQHAAGIIITDGAPVEEYVPLIYGEKNNIMMSQCDMVQAEEIGLLKMDFLGLNNLTIITETAREIYKRTGKCIDMDKIPFDDKKVFRYIFSEAMTNSVFQFESAGMKKMLQGFKPESIFDLILLVAMFRPGPIQFLGDVIDVKQKRKKAEYLTPKLEPILGNTYGSITYQEQVQEIFKQLAGYSLGQADLVRRAMSKKKEKVLAAERVSFIHGDPERNIPGCVKNGISEDVANKLFDEMSEFAKYAFNKSHAACYAVVAYQTAWLKLHYPKEYMKSVLNNVDFKKVPGLVRDLKAMKIKVQAPDINRSGLNFTLQDDCILFGLGSVKGLGDSVFGVIKEREAHGPYQSIADFVIRTGGQKKILEKLTDAGAFDCFCKNRTAIQDIIPEYLTAAKKVKDYTKKLSEQYDPSKIAAYQEKLEAAKIKIRQLRINTSICENEFEKLKKEKDVLGVFASRHPLELFQAPEKIRAIPIAKAAAQTKRSDVTVIGIISDFAMRPRRKDGAEMGFFTLSDLSGEIPVCCFTDPYALYKKLLYEDAVVKIKGSIITDRDDETKKQISVMEVETLAVYRDTIVISVHGVHELEEGLWHKITPHVSQNGNPVIIYDEVMDEFRNCSLLLSPEVCETLQQEGYKAVLRKTS